MPTLFEGESAFPPSRFVRTPAVVLHIMSEGKQYDILTYPGEIGRNTIVSAAPRDATNTIRKEHAVAVTLGQLCLVYTRDLIHYYVGNSRRPGVTSESKSTLLEYCRANGAADDVGPANAFVSHTWSDKFCDTVDVLLPNHDDCYRAMVEPIFDRSFGSICAIILYALLILFVPFVGWFICPILGRRSYVIEHIARPRWWTPKTVLALGQSRLWIDLFWYVVR